VRHSQSNLISLAMLLQSAEARHSAMPPPETVQEGGSGLIDILAMQRKAQEEREAADAAATRTPVPTVATVRGAETDPDLIAALVAAERRKKRLAIGGIAGAIALVAIAFAVRPSHGAAAAAQTSIVETPAPVVTAVAAPPAPVVVAAPVPPPAEPIASAAAPPAVAVATPPATKAKGKHKGSHAKAKGPKLVKVMSSGVAH
jgi:hypothetical protein